MGVSPVFMDGVVAGMIAEFQTRHSDVQIHQTYGYLDTLEAGLRNGGLDVAILTLNPGQVPGARCQVPGDMDFVPLLSGCNVIACRAEHPLTRLRGIRLEDIAPYSWIAPPPMSPLTRDLQAELRSIGQEEFRVNLSGGTLASMQSVLAGSDALTVLPLSVVFQSRRGVPLAALPLRIDHPNRTLGLLMLQGRQGPPALRRFAAFVLVECRQLQVRIDREVHFSAM